VQTREQQNIFKVSCFENEIECLLLYYEITTTLAKFNDDPDSIMAATN